MQHAMLTLVTLTLLPLGMIVLQNVLRLEDCFGFAGYAFYKIFMLVPPVLYCRTKGIPIGAELLKFRNGRRGLGVAIGLGVLAIVIFWGLYVWLGDLLLDKEKITRQIGDQFRVNARTVLYVAPITIFLNSFLEEFFYRAFAFGRLLRLNRRIAILLPATVFTAQHLLFIHHWVSPLPYAMAVAGLFIFALILQRVYERTDSIVAPWLIHVLGDAAMMAIAVSLLFFE